MGRIKIRNVRKDKRIFSKTARRTNVKNVPGRVVTRGGQCL